MGVRFPICSRFVPVCPLFCASWGPERGQIGTKDDKRGQNGTFQDTLRKAQIAIAAIFHRKGQIAWKLCRKEKPPVF